MGRQLMRCKDLIFLIGCRSYLLFSIVFFVQCFSVAASAPLAEPVLEFGASRDVVKVDDRNEDYRLSAYTYSFRIMVLEGPTGSWRQIFSKGTGAPTATQRGPSVWLRPDSMRLTVGHSTGETHVGPGSSDIPLNEWIHAAITSSGSDGVMKLFIDGRKENSISASGLTTETQDSALWIGNSPTHRGVMARMSDFRIYQRDLSESEVRSLYEGGDIQDGLVGYWPLNEGSGTVAEDRARGNDGVFEGMPKWTFARTFSRDLSKEKNVRPGETITLGPVEIYDPVGDPSYQWYFNGEPVEGATESELVISGVTADDLGTYYVRVADSREPALLESVHKKLPDWPVWEKDLDPLKEGRPGETVTLGPVELYAPDGEVNYQWYFNDEPIEGATSKEHTVSDMTAGDLGEYYVQVDGHLERMPYRSSRLLLDGPRPIVIRNPYKTVEWDSVNQYIANLHSHTIYSDGRGEPEDLIYGYAEAGYNILAITDHDTGYIVREGERDPELTPEEIPLPTWPWTDFIDEKPSRVWEHEGKETAAFYPDLGEKGMLAVVGNEPTMEPHIVSLFNHCGWRPGDAEDDDVRIGSIEEAGGISYWAHPSDYIPGGRRVSRFFDDPSWEETISYFGHYIKNYESCLGIEIQLGGRTEDDLKLWDRLLMEYYRDFDIFAKGSDDNHRATVGRNATLTLVLAEDLTMEAVREALESGHNFVGSRSEFYPVFNSITTDPDQRTIVLDVEDYEEIRWIKNGRQYTSGTSVEYSGMRDAVLRFEVDAGGSTFYSQAFYIW